uniref:ATP synthase complex subunit 8 n=1 Tax=Evania appendigaster TaxID=27486 RepID=C8YLX7_EVAAP|nr:ATP synthase F0 subunit 8 [Evania appendigaster]ACL36002.1 ATP synthase F0 subunit 8 [Evania appendigaster]
MPQMMPIWWMVMSFYTFITLFLLFIILHWITTLLPDSPRDNAIPEPRPKNWKS